ncbi:hypothetical protein OROMI_004271 [Orobanche minor]
MPLEPMRVSPKYQASLAKKNKPVEDRDASSQFVDSQISTSLESDEMMERPIGRKAAKKLKKAANEVKDEDGLELLKTMQKNALAIASSRSESVQMSLQLQKEMINHHCTTLPEFISSRVRSCMERDL